MPQAHRAVVIHRPLEAVFEFVADGANAPKSRSGVLDTAHLAGKDVGEQWSQGAVDDGRRDGHP